MLYPTGRRWCVGILCLAASACASNGRDSTADDPGDDGESADGGTAPAADAAMGDKASPPSPDGPAVLPAPDAKSPDPDSGAPTDSKPASDTAPVTDTARDTTRDSTPPLGDAAVAAGNPCPPAGTPCRIMPMGDSITDGYPLYTGSYRTPLFRLALAAKKSITFVGGAKPNGPTTVDGVPFPTTHEGHSYYTIDDYPPKQRLGLTNLATRVMTTYKPHIVLLMIGTNDMQIPVDTANAPARLGVLIDKIVAAAPDALVVVAQLVPSTEPNWDKNVVRYNTAIPAVVKARADAGKHVIVVDMHGAFTANPKYATEYMADYLHPKDAGHAKMADVWYAAIRGLLKGN